MAQVFVCRRNCRNWWLCSSVQDNLFLADADGLLYAVVEDAVYPDALMQLVRRVDEAGKCFIAKDQAGQEHLAIWVR